MLTQEVLDDLLADLHEIDRKIENLNREGVWDGPKIEHLKQLRSMTQANIRFLARR